MTGGEGRRRTVLDVDAGVLLGLLTWCRCCLVVDVGVVPSHAVDVLALECRPVADILSQWNPSKVVRLPFCGVWCGRWIQVGSVLLKVRGHVVFPTFSLTSVVSLPALSWVIPGVPVQRSPCPSRVIVVGNP